MIYKLTRDGETPHSFYRDVMVKELLLFLLEIIQMVINLMDLQCAIGFGNNTYQRKAKA